MNQILPQMFTQNQLMLLELIFCGTEYVETLRLVAKWHLNSRLIERNRGKVHGYTKNEHKAKYPESFEHLKQSTFSWKPPGGETISQVADRAAKFLSENAHIFHFTNVEPSSGKALGEEFAWKRAVTPWTDEKSVEIASQNWTTISPKN